MTKYDHGKHPNSLKNLVEPWGDPDKAREAQKKGVAARKANKEAREKLAITANEWKSMKKEVLDKNCLLYTSPSPRDRQKSRMPSSA